MSKRKRDLDDDINTLSKKMCKVKLKRKREPDINVNIHKKRRLTEVELISLVEKDVKEKPKEASKEDLRYLLRRMCEMNLRLRRKNKLLQMQNDTLRSRVDSPLALCDIKHIEVI